VVPTPSTDPTPEWLDAWAGYELDLKSLGRSPHTVYQRKCQIRILACHAVAAGLLKAPWWTDAETGAERCRGCRAQRDAARYELGRHDPSWSTLPS
jgi:hypothetical protein